MKIKSISQSVYNILKNDEKEFETLLRIQSEWFQVHIDATQMSWSGYWQKYTAIDTEMYNLLTDYYEEMNEALSVKDFVLQKEYRDISDDLIKKADEHITIAHIPYYTNDSVYDEKAVRKAKAKESATWWKLMNRRKHTNVKPNAAKLVYDNFTNRLRLMRLRQLKNELEEYEAISNEMHSVMLSDTCSYEELLNYTDFSSEWDKHLESYKY